jgi:hypothetical protein
MTTEVVCLPCRIFGVRRNARQSPMIAGEEITDVIITKKKIPGFNEGWFSSG